MKNNYNNHNNNENLSSSMTDETTMINRPDNETENGIIKNVGTKLLSGIIIW